MATSFWSKPIVTTNEEPKPIRGRIELAIVPYTLFLPIEPMEMHVVFSTHVEVLEEPVTPKHVPLILLEIRVSIEVMLIDNVIHASKVLKTLNIVLKDTPIMERPNHHPILLVEFVDTIGEQLLDDLTARVKYVVMGD
jgi:hypothetical protein